MELNGAVFMGKLTDVAVEARYSGADSPRVGEPLTVTEAVAAAEAAAEAAAARAEAEKATGVPVPGTIKRSLLERKRAARGILRKVPMFAEAPTEFVDLLVPALTRWRVNKGALVIREGEPGTSMYMLLSGSVTVAPRSQSTIYTTLGQGDFFGEWGLLSKEAGGVQEKRTADVLADTDCEFLVLSRDDWRGVIQRKEFRQFRSKVKAHARKRQADLARKKGGGAVTNVQYCRKAVRLAVD
jgi:hypothetical protein